jgi:sugar O-acyltransferase (sialic acid O-acetyltransferase NeuD family)
MNLMKKVIIFGPSVFGEIVQHYLTVDSEYEVVAFTANEKFIKKTEFMGLPIIPFESIEAKFPPNEYSMFIALGYQGVNKPREKIYHEAKNKGYELITYINSKISEFGKFEIGDNCFIFENNVIQPFVSIGNNVIMWSGNHIGHSTKIKDNTYISSHVVIAGFVNIGKNCFFGVNSTIRDNINISDECIIGAGSVILKDTKEKEVYSPGGTKPLSISSDQVKRI